MSGCVTARFASAGQFSAARKRPFFPETSYLYNKDLLQESFRETLSRVGSF